MSQVETPAKVVARCLANCPAHERVDFLRELLAHAAAGLVVIEGGEKAAATVYRLADAVSGRDVQS